MRRYFFRNVDGEPSVWWSTNCFDEQGRLWRHGRLWLNVPGNSFRLEWWKGKRLSAGISFSAGSLSDEQLSCHIELPKLFALSFGIRRCPWVIHLPGIRWTTTDETGQTIYNHKNGERELSFRCGATSIHWRLWRHPDIGYSRDWRDRSFYPLDLLLGREQYSETPGYVIQTTIPFPEGNYDVTIKLYTSTWKRKRWHTIKTVNRADLELIRPVPIPGKGENAWDIDEDGIYSMTCQASTVEEALATLRASVERDRMRYGGANWKPEGKE